jgi:type I restriction enzyme S subunit
MTAMDGWTKGTLGELCSIEIGGTPSRSKPEYWDSAKDTSNRWVSIKDLNKRIVCRTAEQITDLGVRNSNVKQQPKGTVLLSFKLSIGRVAFAGCDLYTNEAIAGLRSEELTPEFLFYGLQQWDLLQNVDQAIKGATLNKDKLKKIEFVYPESQVEQAKIAELLSTLDRAIEQTEALIAKQQRIKTGLMQDLLTKGIDEDGNIRSEATHAFKDSPLGRIPVEWDALPLSKLVDEPITYGIVQAGPHQEGGVPYIRTGDMSGDKINRAQLLCTTSVIAKAYKRSEVQPGDIVFALRATVGKVLPITDDLAGANLTQGTAKVSPSNDVDSAFLLWALRTEAVLRSIQLVQKGTTFAEITLSDLRQINIALPRSLVEQQQIARDLNACFDLLKRYNEQSEKLQSLKRGLMHDLLTGKRRVTELLESQAAQG